MKSLGINKMKYLFVERDNKTGRPKEVARLQSGNWIGPDASRIREWLKKEKFSALGGKFFDETSEDHLSMLPKLIYGAYFWVRAEE